MTKIKHSEIVEVVRSVIGRDRAQLHEPEFAGNEWSYVKDCIDTGWVSSVGRKVDEFEHLLGKATGAAHVVAAVNGTAALHMCMLLAGARPGDEIVMPSLTFVATANAASYCGLTPHFADIETVSLGLDPDHLAAHLEICSSPGPRGLMNRATGRRIAGVVVMHAFGHPANLVDLTQVCERFGLCLIEDAAESLGSYYRDRPTGSFGYVGAMSFNGNKIVTTGGGGAILTSDPKVAKRAKHLTTTARVPAGWNFVHDEVGYNYRLPNLNAAMGCAQLERLDSFLSRKRRLAERYRAAFASFDGATFLTEPEGTRSNYWLNNILLDGGTQVREAVLATLNHAGLMARPAWTPMHMLPMYRDCPRSDMSVTEDIFGRLVSLPSSAVLGGDT